MPAGGDSADVGGVNRARAGMPAAASYQRPSAGRPKRQQRLISRRPRWPARSCPSIPALSPPSCFPHSARSIHGAGPGTPRLLDLAVSRSILHGMAAPSKGFGSPDTASASPIMQADLAGGRIQRRQPARCGSGHRPGFRLWCDLARSCVHRAFFFGLFFVLEQVFARLGRVRRQLPPSKPGVRQPACRRLRCSAGEHPIFRRGRACLKAAKRFCRRPFYPGGNVRVPSRGPHSSTAARRRRSQPWSARSTCG